MTEIREEAIFAIFQRKQNNATLLRLSKIALLG